MFHDIINSLKFYTKLQNVFPQRSWPYVHKLKNILKSGHSRYDIKRPFPPPRPLAPTIGINL